MTLENKDQGPSSTQKESNTNLKRLWKLRNTDSDQPPMRGATLERKDQQLNKIMLAEVTCNELCLYA